MKKKILVSTSLVLSIILSGPVLSAEKVKDIILATTTSTQDSGLLDVLIPVFEKEAGYVVKTIAVGSGQAMAMGELSPEQRERLGIDRPLAAQLGRLGGIVLAPEGSDQEGLAGRGREAGEVAVDEVFICHWSSPPS